ncbi:GA-like domain-containing protein [Gallibacterium genomosp. 3]|uniref:Minor extracellular protease Epr GA-like domain-containing protein n=1 Tax=Gallibacterium genomosp. 3 TaxID=505345 RepID=A0A1A7PRX9_9PAST|nr:hypothetical protein [Gallibacterium genomosp. 3]OBX04477.1 hypothetical protein QV07_10195 [Gallibacterium genomosp. 3]
MNDKDPANGVQDDIDAKIKAAEDAKVAADKAAEEAKKDGVITAEEAKAVEDANTALEAEKEAAKEAIKQAPVDKQTELNNKVDALTPAKVPDVTKPMVVLAEDTGDSDSDGISNNGILKFKYENGVEINSQDITGVTVNGEALQSENGVYKLPEGKYEAGSINFTTKSGLTGQNAAKVLIDTTSYDGPFAMVSQDKEGTSLTLSDAIQVGDRVVVKTENGEITLTKGDNGWTSDHPELATLSGNKLVIPFKTAPSQSTLTAVVTDVAGNTSQALNHTVTDPNNPANTTWDDGKTGLQITDFLDKDLETVFKDGVVTLDYLGEKLRDPDSTSPKLIGPKDWTHPSSMMGNDYSDKIQYRVVDGKLEVKMDPNDASLMSGGFAEKFEVQTSDGSKLYIGAQFNPRDVSVDSMVLPDDEGYLGGGDLFSYPDKNNNVPWTTDDKNWSNLKVALKAEPYKPQYIQLTIEGPDGLVIKEVQQTSTKELTFDLSKYKDQLKDGDYTVKATRVADSNGTSITDNEVTLVRQVNIDTVAPVVTVDGYSKGEDGRYYANLTVSDPHKVSYRTLSDGMTVESAVQNADGKASLIGENTQTLKLDVANNNRVVFFDEAGNATEVTLTDIKYLNRITSNLTVEEGPNNPENDSNKGQVSSGDGYKASNEDDIIVVHKPSSNNDEYAGFIDGGTGAGDASITVDTGDGNDVIDARGIGGHTIVRTGEGNDTINLGQGFMGYGPWYGYFGGMDGPQKVDMGAGDDTLSVGKFSMWGPNHDYAPNSFLLTTANINMGDGNDKIETAGTIWADGDDKQYYSNYFNLGAGNDTMIIHGQLTDNFNPNNPSTFAASNVLDLGTGHDRLVVDGDVSGQTLILSRDSSEMVFRNNVKGVTSFILGNGADNLTFAGHVDLQPTNSQSLGSIVYNFNNTPTWYEGSKDLLETIRSDSAAFINVGGGDNTLTFNHGLWNANVYAGAGNDTLTVSESIGYSSLELGSGTNTVKIGTNIWDSKIITGEGQDTINISAEIGRTEVSIGAGNDSVNVGTWMQQGVNVNLGDGDDVITVSTHRKDVSGTSSVEGGEGYDVFNAENSVALGMYGAHTNGVINLTNVEEINLKGSSLITVGVQSSLSGITTSNYKDYSGEFFIHGGASESVTLENSSSSGRIWKEVNSSVTHPEHSGHTYKEYVYQVDGQDTGIKLYLDEQLKFNSITI